MSLQNAVPMGQPQQFRKVLQNRAPKGYGAYLLSTPNLETTGFRTEYFQNIADDFLTRFYPQTCNVCGDPMRGRVATRPYVAKCGTCRTEKSLLSATPFRNLRLPFWHLGWTIDESLRRASGVLTAADIQRSLGIRYSSAHRLKRRVQVFCAQHLDRLRDLMRAELSERFQDVELPKPDPTNIDHDITAALKDKRIPQTDTIALFSSRGTANKGRKRHRAHGQTASIYRADSLGGDQTGTLLNSLTWAGGPLLLDSTPDQKARTILPLLERVVPRGVPLFGDFGIDWYGAHNRAARFVNHSLPARRGKGKSRRRWQQNGIHTNAVEGRQGAVKTAFRQYRYFRPKYSGLYAAEYSLLSGIRYYGIERLARHASRVTTQAKRPASRTAQSTTTGRSTSPAPGAAAASQIGASRWVGRGSVDDGVERSARISRKMQHLIEPHLYKPQSLDERRELNPQARAIRDARAQLPATKRQNPRLGEAIEQYIAFHENSAKSHRRRKEKQYAFAADKLWKLLSDSEFNLLSDVCRKNKIPPRIGQRIALRWSFLGIATVVDRTHISRENKAYIFDVRKNMAALPLVCYMVVAENQASTLSAWWESVNSEYRRTPRRSNNTDETRYTQQECKTKGVPE